MCNNQERAQNYNEIISKTCDLIKTRYGNLVEELTISDLVMGVFMTVIRLSDGSCGVASTSIDDHRPCCKKNRDFGDFSPSKIIGHKMIDLLETDKSSAILDTLKITALNAFSMQHLTGSGYKIIEDMDPVDLIDLKSRKTITLVGAFQSYIDKISQTDNKLYVLELDENMLREDQKQYYVPAEKYTQILPMSDIIIITGLTLINNTIDGLLSSVLPQSQVIVTGPSGSMLPDVLFENKVDIIGATRITDPSLAFALAGQGGRVYHLYRYCARKICVINNREK